MNGLKFLAQFDERELKRIHQNYKCWIDEYDDHWTHGIHHSNFEQRFLLKAEEHLKRDYGYKWFHLLFLSKNLKLAYGCLKEVSLREIYLLANPSFDS